MNGNRVDIFESELFDPICKQIQGACEKLNIVNGQISDAISNIVNDDTSVTHENNNKEIERKSNSTSNNSSSQCIRGVTNGNGPSRRAV